jgi:hypothetical protein
MTKAKYDLEVVDQTRILGLTPRGQEWLAQFFNEQPGAHEGFGSVEVDSKDAYRYLKLAMAAGLRGTGFRPPVSSIKSARRGKRG